MIYMYALIMLKNIKIKPSFYKINSARFVKEA